MPQDRFEEIFNQRLHDVEVAAPSGLWDKIQGELPPPTPFYRRPSFLAACLGAFLLVSGSLGYFATHYDIQIVEQADADANVSAVSTELASANDIRFDESFADRAKRNYGTFVAKSLDAVEGVQSSLKNTIASLNASGLKNTVSQSVSDVQNVSAETVALSSQTAQAIPAEAIAEFSYDQKPIQPKFFASILSSDQMDTPNAIALRGGLVQDDASALIEHSGFNAINKKRKGLHIGGFYGYNNTWIVSQSFGQKDLRSSNVTYDVDFGGNYGVAVGYDFSNRWGIQAEWVINSTYRQNYTYRWEGSRHIADIKLNYLQLPLLVKYHVPKEKSTISYVMGVRLARLKSAGLEVNTPSLRVVDLLNTNELGAIIGMDYEYHMNRNYFLTVGARGSVGRAYNSWSEIRDSSKPYNVAVGLRLGLHYNFAK